MNEYTLVEQCQTHYLNKYLLSLQENFLIGKSLQDVLGILSIKHKNKAFNY